jgi:hypothetical protein
MSAYLALPAIPLTVTVMVGRRRRAVVINRWTGPGWLLARIRATPHSGLSAPLGRDSNPSATCLFARANAFDGA